MVDRVFVSVRCPEKYHRVEGSCAAVARGDFEAVPRSEARVRGLEGCDNCYGGRFPIFPNGDLDELRELVDGAIEDALGPRGDPRREAVRRGEGGVLSAEAPSEVTKGS